MDVQDDLLDEISRIGSVSLKNKLKILYQIRVIFHNYSKNYRKKKKILSKISEMSSNR
jgi:hypothetical protein